MTPRNVARRWHHVIVPLLTGAYALAAALTLTVALVIMGTLALRRRPGSQPPPGSPGRPGPRPYGREDFGLLRTVALVENLDTGEVLRAVLTAGGVPATVATGRDGLVHVLVFPEGYEQARRMVGHAGWDAR